MDDVDADDSLRGKLLVASPALVDPNFARTVVLMTEHNSDGAMGIVLNRPADELAERVCVGPPGGRAGAGAAPGSRGDRR